LTEIGKLFGAVDGRLPMLPLDPFLGLVDRGQKLIKSGAILHWPQTRKGFPKARQVVIREQTDRDDTFIRHNKFPNLDQTNGKSPSADVAKKYFWWFQVPERLGGLFVRGVGCDFLRRVVWQHPGTSGLLPVRSCPPVRR
jgi:hypothetical protein